MNKIKKFFNWFTNNDLREDVALLEDIIYSEEGAFGASGLMEDVSHLEDLTA